MAAERDPIKRAAFQEAIAQIDAQDLVLLDECGFSLALHLLYGWGPAKERLVEAVPAQRGVNRSVLGAFGGEGMVAITSKPGAIKRVDVEAFLREELLPRLLPGSVLVRVQARLRWTTRAFITVVRSSRSFLRQAAHCCICRRTLRTFLPSSWRGGGSSASFVVGVPGMRRLVRGR